MDFSGLACALFLDIYSRGYMRGRILCFFCLFVSSACQAIKVYIKTLLLCIPGERERFIYILKTTRQPLYY